MLHDRQAGIAEEPLHHVFVHAGGGAKHARADVRDVGQLQQALDGAILAEGAMQHGEDDVDIHRIDARAKLMSVGFERHERGVIFSRHGRHDNAFAPRQHCRGLGSVGIAGAQVSGLGSIGRLALQQAFGMGGRYPAAFLGDADGHHFVFALVDCVQDRGRRQQGDFMLAAAPAKQDAYPEFLHESILTPQVYVSSDD